MERTKTNQPASPPPSLTKSELTGPEKAAQARRENAFRELGVIQQKVSNQLLALLKVDLPAGLPNGASFVIQAAPGAYAEAIGTLVVQFKQLEIGMNVLTDMLIEAGVIDRVAYWDKAAQYAERAGSLMQRAVLSQGQQGGGIVRPS